MSNCNNNDNNNISTALVADFSLFNLMQDEQKIMYSAEDMKACPVDTTSRIIGKKFTVLYVTC
jgi:hypothetical protein